MRAYELVPDDELTEKSLLEDQDFLQDASQFMAERTGNEYFEPQEIMDNFLEHMRYGNVNEITMLRDLEYAQETDEVGAERFGRLIDTYERMDTDFGLGSFVDYGQGVLTAPSTYGAIVTGGSGKFASQAAIQAGKQGIRQVIKHKMRGFGQGAAKGAVFEGVVGAGQEAIRQETREEVGLERQDGSIAMAGLFSAGFGGLFGGLGGMAGQRASEVADETYNAAQKSLKQRKEAQKAINTSEQEKLRRLNPELVKEGQELLDQMNLNKNLSARVDAETIESAVTATVRLGAGLKRKEGQRITEAVAEAIADGRITSDQIKKVKAEHRLTDEQFASIYLASVSDMARGLKRHGDLKKMLGDLAKGRVIDDDVAESAAKEIGSEHKAYEFLRSADRLRLGLMTSQIATTVRNAMGGGFRTAVDIMDQSWGQAAAVLTGKKSAKEAMDYTFLTAKHLFTQKEARVIQEMFSERMPEKARSLFFSAADAETRSGSNTILGQIGTKVNVLNTWSDNMFKRAIFSSTLDRELRNQGTSLRAVARGGYFDQIDEKTIQKAVDESLYFAYQKTPGRDTTAGKLGRAGIELHHHLPFFASTFVPFPRFIMNQLRFVQEHMPVIGAAYHAALGRSVKDNDMLAKQMTGMSLIMMASMFRAQQDDDLDWNEVRDEKGTVYDLTATLGPMAPFMWAGDTIQRAYRNKPLRKTQEQMSELAVLLGSPRMKGQFGGAVVEKAIDDMADGKGQRAIARLIGDTMGTFTIPVNMFRDASAAFSKDARYIEDMNKIIESSGNSGVDILRYSLHYASKYLPSWKEDGINFDVPESRRAFSPTKGELKRSQTLEKFFLGATAYTPKSTFESEVDRLRLERNEVFKQKSDPIRNALTKYALASQLPDHMEGFILSPDYRNASDARKAKMLINEAHKFAETADVKSWVDELMATTTGRDKPYAYSHLLREQYENLNFRSKKVLEEEWEKTPMYNGESISERGAYNWALQYYNSLPSEMK